MEDLEVWETLYNGGSSAPKASSQAKKVNSELNNPRNRQIGLVNLNKLLNLCNEEILCENVSRWIKIMAQVVVQTKETSSARKLAATNLRLLLLQSSQISAASREISSNSVVSILTDLLQSSTQDEPVLSSILCVATIYPNPCGVLRSRIVKCMMPMMIQPFKSRRIQAIRCWAQVPFLGGGGAQRSTHSTQWENQTNQTLEALRYALEVYVANDERGLDPSQGSLSLPFPDLPQKEPDCSYALVQRISTLCECLHMLLDVDFPYALPVPMQDFMDVMLQILNILPSKMGHTTEMLLRASCLENIQESVLQLFVKLTEICRRNLCRQSAAVNSTFLSLLSLWKDDSPVAGKRKKHSTVRIQIYTAILNWIQMCGATTRFLCGPSYVNQGFLKHLVDDITPVKDCFAIPTSRDTGLSGKAKRRKLAKGQHSLLNGTSSDRVMDEKANSELCQATLKVILASVNTMGHRLHSSVHKTLQETVISILLNFHQRKAGVLPCARCHSSRMLLYQTLLALTLSPSPSLAPPVALAKQILTLALSKETDLELRGFCLTAIASIDNIVQPWRSAWHRCTVDTGESMKELQIGTIIEPMNTKNGNFCQNCSTAIDKDSGAPDGATPDDEADVEAADDLVSHQDSEMDASELPVDLGEGGGDPGTATSNGSGMTTDGTLESPEPSAMQQDSTMDGGMAPTAEVPSGQGDVAGGQTGKKTFRIPENGAIMTSSDDDITVDDEIAEAKVKNTNSAADCEVHLVTEDGGEVEKPGEEVNLMLLDFVDASPDTDDE